MFKLANAHEALKVRKAMFPDNYYNYKAEHDNLDFSEESRAFIDILNKAQKENDVQTYIKQNKKWFIPYSILDGYPFYNHAGAFLFKEYPLGERYTADYCLIGDNSDGWHIVLVEFENPNTPYVLSSTNGETEDVRKGLVQIRDWKLWMDDNRAYFIKNIGLSKFGIDVPVSNIHYCLIVSRRHYMNDSAKLIRSRQMYEQQNLRIVSYDRIADNIARIYGGAFNGQA